MYRFRNKKTVVIIALFVMTCFMAIGYSILMSELKISGSANITSTWDIRITGITCTSDGSAYNIEAPTFTATSAKFRVAVVEPGDQMSCSITIKNQGTLTGILNGISMSSSGSDAIVYTTSGLKEGDTIAGGDTKTLYVYSTYSTSGVIVDPNERMKKLDVDLDWVQYINQTITPKTYTVKYNSNGGSGSMSNTTCTVGSSCTLSSNAFTRTGYVFDGWALSKDGPVVYTNTASNGTLASAGETVNLYAVWKQLIFGNFNSSTYATLVAVDLTNEFEVSVYFDVVHNSARKLILGNYPSDGTGLTNFNIEMTTANQLRVYQGTNFERSYDITEGVHNLKVEYVKSQSLLSIYIDGGYIASFAITPYTSASKTAKLMVGKDHRTGTSPFTTYMPVSDISFTSSAARYNWELTPEGYVDTLTNTKATLTGNLTYYTY